MARPKKEEKEKRLVTSISLPPKKMEKLIEKAGLFTAGNVSHYISKMLDGNSVLVKNSSDSSEKINRTEFYALVRELNTMGSNLNQLVKKTYLGFNMEIELKENLSLLLNKKEEIMNFLVEKLGK